MSTTDERRAAKLVELYRGYAIHFAADWDMDRNTARGATWEPTDANLATVLDGCARAPRPEEYPAIRRHVMKERNAQARRDIGEAIGTGDPSIVTNVIHALVTEHGDLTRLPREELSALARGAFSRLYGR